MIFISVFVSAISYSYYFLTYVPYTKLSPEWRELVWNITHLKGGPINQENVENIFGSWKEYNPNPSTLTTDQYNILNGFLKNHINMAEFRKYIVPPGNSKYGYERIVKE